MKIVAATKSSTKRSYEDIIKGVSSGIPYDEAKLKQTFEVVYEKGTYTEENLVKVLGSPYLQITKSDLLISANNPQEKWLTQTINCENNEHHTPKIDEINEGVQIMSNNKAIVLISFTEGMKTPKELTHVPRCLTAFHFQRIIWAKFLSGCSGHLPNTIEECVEGHPGMKAEVFF